MGPGRPMWNHNGSKQSPFERLPILPQANEQEKGNEVCIMVLFVGVGQTKREKAQRGFGQVQEFSQRARDAVHLYGR